MTLESDGVGERADGSVLVLPIPCQRGPSVKGDVPSGRSQTGDTLNLWNLALVDWDLTELTWLLVPLDRVGAARQT